MAVVNIVRRIKTPEGKRYYPVVLTKNGRVVPDVVVIDGKEETRKGGTFYLDWIPPGKPRCRRAVGKDATEALNEKKKLEYALLNGEKAPEILGAPDLGPLVEDTVKAFLEKCELKNMRRRSIAAYRTALEYFKESLQHEEPPKAYLKQIDEMTLLRYAKYLRDEREQADRSVSNKFTIVLTFLRSNKIFGLVDPNNKPKFTEKKPEIYDKKQLQALWAASDPTETLWWKFFIMTGMREQEVYNAQWRDVHLDEGIIWVREKQDVWQPKTYKERSIPIPDELAYLLKKHKTIDDTPKTLIFHTDSGGMKMDFLHCLKYCVRRAGLDEDSYKLHKFRATFASWHYWRTHDLFAVRELTGHTDLKSIERYVVPDTDADTKAELNAMYTKRIGIGKVEDDRNHQQPKRHGNSGPERRRRKLPLSRVSG